MNVIAEYSGLTRNESVLYSEVTVLFSLSWHQLSSFRVCEVCCLSFQANFELMHWIRPQLISFRMISNSLFTFRETFQWQQLGIYYKQVNKVYIKPLHAITFSFFRILFNIIILYRVVRLCFSLRTSVQKSLCTFYIQVTWNRFFVWTYCSTVMKVRVFWGFQTGYTTVGALLYLKIVMPNVKWYCFLCIGYRNRNDWS